MLKYWQKVRVKSWFYEGIEWIVYREAAWFLWREFIVNLLNKEWRIIAIEVFRESNLEIIL